jgi:hypothetical protein
MREFGEFMETMDLVDLPLLGRRFTWFHPNGRSMSRIDKFLVSEEWSDVWGVCSLWVLPRDISDHCPLILKKDNFDLGPRPFRFNNYWLEHKNFKKIVEETWRNHNVSGWMGHILKEKLKNLKYRLKEWSKEEFGGMEARISSLVEDIHELDGNSEGVGLSDLEVASRKVKFCDLWKLLKCKEANLFQRSRSK